jgi:hypothetical protein
MEERSRNIFENCWSRGGRHTDKIVDRSWETYDNKWETWVNEWLNTPNNNPIIIDHVSLIAPDKITEIDRKIQDNHDLISNYINSLLEDKKDYKINVEYKLG